MKILFVAIVLITIATGLKTGFANGLLTLGIELVPVAIWHAISKGLEDDDR